jgi:hypothetical protein
MTSVGSAGVGGLAGGLAGMARDGEGYRTRCAGKRGDGEESKGREDADPAAVRGRQHIPLPDGCRTWQAVTSQSRRTSGTGLAAIAMRRVRHTHGAYGRTG